MAFYSLTLPHTPPEGRSGDFLLAQFRDSRELLRNRPLVVFLFVSMLACVPSMAYNNYGNLFLNNQGYPSPGGTDDAGAIVRLAVPLGNALVHRALRPSDCSSSAA